MDEDEAIVLDIGSSRCKVGFAGEDFPKAVFPLVTGRARVHRVMRDTVPRDLYVGEHAQRSRNLYDLCYPVDRGIVQDWECLETIWSHTLYNELRIDSRDYPVLWTDPPMNPKINRERMCEMMFESFEVPAFYVKTQAILSMYASGRGSGVMLDSGDGVTHVLPVYEGYCISHAIQRLDLAGTDLNMYLARLLCDKGYSFLTSSELELMRFVKEDLCYVSQDYKQELQSLKTSGTQERTYKLPDGRYISVGDERFKTPEALFDPRLIGSEYPGFHKLVYKCIMNCDIDVRRDLMCNVILSGGNTMFPGFPDRLQKELKELCPARQKVRCVAAPEREYNVWIGGSILASLSTFQQLWITKGEYNEHGPQIVHQKCI